MKHAEGCEPCGTCAWCQDRSLQKLKAKKLAKDLHAANRRIHDLECRLLAVEAECDGAEVTEVTPESLEHFTRALRIILKGVRLPVRVKTGTVP